MASLTTESAGRVRQKATNAVYGTGTGTSTDSVSPYHYYAVKSLFLYLAANKGNPDLQFIPYAAEDAVTAGGYVPFTGAATLYAWFGKARRTSGTTAAFETVYDGISGGDSASVTGQIAVHHINATGQQFLDIYPNGKALATGLAISSDTALGGVTESTAANSTDGFLIVGA